MKRIITLLAVAGLGLSVIGQEPAQVTVYCTSLLFEPATAGPGQAITLRMTTDSSFGEFNGEVGPFFDPELPTHGSLFVLEDPTFPDNLRGQIAFDTPAPTDANRDGFNDFFQVTQGVETTTTRGFFESPVESGEVTATWSRAPGAASGTCQIELTGEIFGELPAFTHTFQLLEYNGTLTYAPGTNGVTGTLELAQTQRLSETLSGAVTITRVATNRFDWLDLEAGTLTNASGESLTYHLAELERDKFAKTNYFGFLDFVDGNPATGTIDFWDWVLSIDDPNDADADGIPDLSDDQVETPPSDLALGLSQSAGRLLLSIRGEPGRSYDIEHTEALGRAAWVRTMSVTLTNTAQVIEIEPPQAQATFWRAREP